jgi:hypothetical protein
MLPPSSLLGARILNTIPWKSSWRLDLVPLDDLLGQVWTWRDDKVWRIVTYTDPRDALEAAGLSE